ncbi:MAG: hypothetical protein U0800_05670 [Isosphaeraceae bacterium]
MPRPPRRRLMLTFGAIALAMAPPLLWLGLIYKPTAYRRVKLAELPQEQRQVRAKHFVAQSLQLRNDIVNERRWEARFSDSEVNAWLAEELLATFADQIPPEVHDPRLLFEDDRVTLLFEVDRGPIRTVVTVQMRAFVPEDNTVALTIDRIHAGILPLPPDQFVRQIGAQAAHHGLDIRWGRDGRSPVAFLQYRADPDREGFVLERVQLLDGQLRMSGRSDPAHGKQARPTLPNRRLLQSKFPRRNRQGDPSAELPSPPRATFQIATRPFS